jgi:hypothetical protein
MTRIGRLVAAAWLALGTAAQAGDPVVVELFTSQGCSSCPPADRIFSELAQDEDIIPLALHVDYWDYLGWRDVFGSPAYSDRQRAYAHARGERMVYTPQMVIGGIDQVVGSRVMKVAKLLRKHAERDLPVDLTLERHGDEIAVRAEAEGDLPEMIVLMVTYLPEATIEIERGENAGRTITYNNIVQDMVPLGTWDGQGVFTATAPAPEGRPVVVLVQAEGAGPIMGASRLR